MNNLEFLSFSETPNEKYLGIATIRVEKRFIFRYKISPNPRGVGFFLNVPSVKIDDSNKPYKAAFFFESIYENEQIESFVEENVKKLLTIKSDLAPEQKKFNFNNPNAQQGSFFEAPPF